MPIEAEVIYRNRDQIVADLITRMQSRIPDIHVEEDGNFRMFAEVLAEVLEGVYLANQIQRDNIFVTSANLVELRRHGEQYGLVVKSGTPSTGSLLFSGAGGTVIETGAMVGLDVGEGDTLYFLTTADAVIPFPGDATAPTIVDSGVASNPVAGTYEYGVSFVTVAGETEMGLTSLPLVTSASRRIDVSAIAIGGPGTLYRKLYRQRDGGGFKFITQIANNTATTFQDTIAEGSLGAAPPEASTAERVTTTAESEEPGERYNAAIGTILELIQVPDGVTDVTNTTVFAGGTDEEDMEVYRSRLLDFIRNPRTGSVADLVAWAEAIDGVESAAAFSNDNLGTPTNGHATVRIAGPGGTIPDAGVVAAVLADLQARDMANITVHVGTFSAVSTNVTVVLTLSGGYILADVTTSVQEAITNYINSIPIGGTVYVSGLIDAIFGLPGIATVSVTTPATDQTATATQKRVPGTILVT